MTTMIAPLERPLAWLRRSWRAMGLGRRHDGGHYRRMDRLYLRHDPWRLSSERERQRFHLTNALVARIAPDCGSLLELGSAEGAQTAHLLSVARNVTGIEVSPVAVGRARQTVPCADYLIGPAEDAVRLVRGRRFDLVMASELLYYAPEPSAILTAMKSLASSSLVFAVAPHR